jgi:hypothetical protein
MKESHGIEQNNFQENSVSIAEKYKIPKELIYLLTNEDNKWYFGGYEVSEILISLLTYKNNQYYLDDLPFPDRKI